MYSHYKPRRNTENVDSKVHIFAAKALGRGRVTSPTLDRLYIGKAAVLILQEVEWTPGLLWTRKNEGKSPLLHRRGSNPDRPTRSQPPCRLNHLVHMQFNITNLPIFFIKMPINIKISYKFAN